MSSEQQVGLSDIGKSSNGRQDGCTDDESNLPTWKERIDISIAKSRKIRGSNYVQISTIDYGTMEPRCRTVVFRGFMKGVPVGAVEDAFPCSISSNICTSTSAEPPGECVMKMITDVRSNKVKELNMFHELMKNDVGKRNSNTVETVWWFPKSSEQYRIGGRLQFIGNDGPVMNGEKPVSADTKQYFISERKQQWGNLSDPAREQFFWEQPGVPFTSTWEEGKDVPAGGRDVEGKVLPPPDTFLLMLLYPTKVDYLRLGDNFRQSDERKESWKSKRVNP